MTGEVSDEYSVGPRYRRETGAISVLTPAEAGRSARARRGIAVLLADDHEVILDGLRAVLARDDAITVVGAVHGVPELLDRIGRDQPDVVLVGASLLRVDDFRVARLLAGQRVVVATQDDSDELLVSAIAAGVSGYLPLGSPGEEFPRAIRAVAEGGAYLPAHVTKRVFESFQIIPLPDPSAPALLSLTEREGQVLRAIGQGRSNREIAREFEVSETTVKSHVSRVLAKLELRDRVQAALLAWRLGLVTAREAPEVVKPRGASA
ncbi:hypothetical protein SUDANB95_02032 [Actinosynnema sp. ALI-1.44]|uniref:Response regulator transcription factor n=1 Tax=Saccharothrix mutabilis subsp. mutabilis TaxID=66855 RepID=A0ABP3DZZ1_9PSEU